MWYFFSPKIIYGEDALDFLDNISGSKCFIVSDKIIEELGYLKIIIERLEKLGKKYETYLEVLPDPKEDQVLVARNKCIEFGPDLIIALGGGSVMDTAKAVWAMYEFPDIGIDDMHPFNNKLYEMGKKAKLIAIPTTSGTGADTTFAIVVSRLNNDVWQKLIQAHRGLIPTYAIVDPVFPMGMPKELTIDTGFDALSHALECFISLWKNEFSNALALKSVELIFKYLPLAVKDGKSKEARNFLHQAATMAGLAFGNANVHIAHTMGHCLGAVFHIPHGRSVGIMLKYVTQYCLNNPNKQDESIKIYAKVAKQLGWAKWEESDRTAAMKVIEKVTALQNELNFPLTLQDLGISKKDLESNLDTLVNLCFQDASGSMCPRLPMKEDFENIYRYARQGKDIDF